MEREYCCTTRLATMCRGASVMPWSLALPAYCKHTHSEILQMTVSDTKKSPKAHCWDLPDIHLRTATVAHKFNVKVKIDLGISVCFGGDRVVGAYVNSSILELFSVKILLQLNAHVFVCYKKLLVYYTLSISNLLQLLLHLEVQHNAF